MPAENISISLNKSPLNTLFAYLLGVADIWKILFSSDLKTRSATRCKKCQGKSVNREYMVFEDRYFHKSYFFHNISIKYIFKNPIMYRGVDDDGNCGSSAETVPDSQVGITHSRKSKLIVKF